MTNKYTIDFTDENSERQFIIQPYSTNGPEFPTSNDLSSTSTDAATSLLLYGKGIPNYGERIAENFVHLLEHFAGTVEPTYPVAGQLWYRKDISPSQLYVYNETSAQIVSNPSGQGINYFSVNGDHTSRFVSNFRIRIFDPSNNDKMEEYLVVTNSTYDSSADKTTFQVSPAPPTTRANGQWYIGGWEPVLQNNAALNDDLDVGGHRLFNVSDPQADGDALNRLYADNRYVQLSGDTLTGLLTLSGDPVNNLHAATKQYVDNEIGSRSLLVSGMNSMLADMDLGSHRIVNVLNPNDPQDAATKQYVDNATGSGSGGGGVVTLGGLNDVQITPPPLADGAVLIYDAGASTWVNSDQTDPPFISRSGGNPDGVMTGFLTLNADPVNNLHAATKQYVDNEVAASAGGTPSVANSGHTFEPYMGRLTLQRTDSSTFVITGFDYQSLSIDHQIRPLWEDDNGSDYLERRHWDDTDFPTYQSSEMIQHLSEAVGSSRERNRRAVFTADGTSTNYATFIEELPKTTITAVEGLQSVDSYPDSSTIQIAGDHTNEFTGGSVVYITGGSNESGSPYTVSSGGSSYDGTADLTTIPIDETLSSTTTTNDAVFLAPRVILTSGGTSNSNIELIAQNNDLSSIQINTEVVDPGTNNTLSVSVFGNAITITLGHDGTSVTSTANDVVSLLNGDANASALVTAYAIEGDGTGLVQTTDPVYLEGIRFVLSVDATSSLIERIPFEVVSGPNAGTYTVGENGSDGTGVPVESLAQDSTGALVVTDQRDAQYIIGYEHINVFVNGQKFVASTRGSAAIRNDPDDQTVQGTGFFISAPTGLQSGTMYSFTITIDNGSSQTVSVDGANAQTFGDLAEQISNSLTAAIAVVEQGQLIIYSTTTGTGSSVIIEDTPASGETALISSLVGEDVSGPPSAWSSTTSYTTGDKVEYNNEYYYALQPNTNVLPSNDRFVWRLVQTYAPQLGRMHFGTTYGFEEVGEYNSLGSAINFTAAPSQGAVIEAIVSKTQAFAN